MVKRTCKGSLVSPLAGRGCALRSVRYVMPSEASRLITMHELSIAVSLVDAASEEAAQAGAERVSAVHLKLGALSGVVRDALAFSFDIATENTMLEGAALNIKEVPAVAFCPRCQAEKQLTEVHPAFRAACPACGTPTPELRQGKELEITAIEIH